MKEITKKKGRKAEGNKKEIRKIKNWQEKMKNRK